MSECRRTMIWKRAFCAPVCLFGGARTCRSGKTVLSIQWVTDARLKAWRHRAPAGNREFEQAAREAE